MGKIDELIKQLCPDGVKFVKLGDFFDMFKGISKVSKKWADTGNCKFIDYLNIYYNNKPLVRPHSLSSLGDTQESPSLWNIDSLSYYQQLYEQNNKNVPMTLFLIYVFSPISFSMLVFFLLLPSIRLSESDHDCM